MFALIPLPQHPIKCALFPQTPKRGCPSGPGAGFHWGPAHPRAPRPGVPEQLRLARGGPARPGVLGGAEQPRGWGDDPLLGGGGGPAVRAGAAAEQRGGGGLPGPHLRGA